VLWKTYSMWLQVLVVFSALLSERLIAQDHVASPDGLAIRARQILLQRCVACHGPERQQASLRLDQHSFLLSGGESGQSLVPGRSVDSLLLARVAADDPDSRMPPTGIALSESDQRVLRDWIDAGAPWPNVDAARDSRLDHWAWQPWIVSAIPPTSTHAIGSSDDTDEPKFAHPLQPIDSFVDTELVKQGLSPQPPASKQQRIRRAYFDLLGLPPSPDAVDAFEKDDAPDAWERLIDSLLASPAYGERWARHWLDIAHYADTHGFERDQRRDHAWRYRDWVIDALNADMPYDAFLRQQIAGDVLYPDSADATIASSFLAAGPWDFVGQAETPSPVIKRLARADDLDDMVAQVMTSTCAITIHCARCHDHKLDPISQAEYYRLSAIFSGVRRGDRLVSKPEADRMESARVELSGKRLVIEQSLRRATRGFDLADAVGGGNGFGTGVLGRGVDASTGATREPKETRDFLKDVLPNRLSRTDNPFIHCVFVPNGESGMPIAIAIPNEASDTGSSVPRAIGIPKTDTTVWDAIRNGPVHAQHATRLGEIDYAGPEHSMLSLHANAAITFDLRAIEASGYSGPFVFQSGVGYFGQTPREGADVRVWLDGQLIYERKNLGRDDGLQSFQLELGDNARYLTLMATDAGNGIGHDQICFVDPWLHRQGIEKSPETQDTIAQWTKEREAIDARLSSIGDARRVYGVIADVPAEIRVLHRGNPEDPRDTVLPGTVQCVAPGLGSIGELGPSATDTERRIALATWITHPDNPLPARVLVNRLWHHHFGMGIVATPSDFGLGGGLPSHPELLDWLANEFQRSGWSIKSMHRLICLSNAYQRSSLRDSPSATKSDSSNRWLWRQNPRRLDAESLRDAILSMSGALNSSMHGPGYQDFEYQEEYAPIYRHRTTAGAEMFRRSIYRFIVRTTPHPFLTTLDCPNPANMTPVRTTTTTAIQSLAMLNNDFIFQQSDLLAASLEFESGGDVSASVVRALRLAFGREPTIAELDDAKAFVEQSGLRALGRILWNMSEFTYVD
jgi:mono/diheme cytochrome c family protein